jgi:hypothetical protein
VSISGLGASYLEINERKTRGKSNPNPVAQRGGEDVFDTTAARATCPSDSSSSTKLNYLMSALAQQQQGHSQPSAPVTKPAPKRKGRKPRNPTDVKKNKDDSAVSFPHVSVSASASAPVRQVNSRPVRERRQTLKATNDKNDDNDDETDDDNDDDDDDEEFEEKKKQQKQQQSSTSENAKRKPRGRIPNSFPSNRQNLAAAAAAKTNNDTEDVQMETNPATTRTRTSSRPKRAVASRRNDTDDSANDDDDDDNNDDGDNHNHDCGESESKNTKAQQPAKVEPKQPKQQDETTEIIGTQDSHSSSMSTDFGQGKIVMYENHDFNRPNNENNVDASSQPTFTTTTTSSSSQPPTATATTKSKRGKKQQKTTTADSSTSSLSSSSILSTNRRNDDLPCHVEALKVAANTVACVRNCLSIQHALLQIGKKTIESVLANLDVDNNNSQQEDITMTKVKTEFKVKSEVEVEIKKEQQQPQEQAAGETAAPEDVKMSENTHQSEPIQVKIEAKQEEEEVKTCKPEDNNNNHLSPLSVVVSESMLLEAQSILSQIGTDAYVKFIQGETVSADNDENHPKIEVPVLTKTQVWSFGLRFFFLLPNTQKNFWPEQLDLDVKAKTLLPPMTAETLAQL